MSEKQQQGEEEKPDPKCELDSCQSSSGVTIIRAREVSLPAFLRQKGI